MRITINELRNVDKLKEVLISLGVSEELLKCRAFNVALKTISDNVYVGDKFATDDDPRKVDFSNITATKGEDGKSYRITTYDGKNEIQLAVEFDDILLYSRRVSPDGMTAENTYVKVRAFQGGNLAIRTLSGIGHKDDRRDQVGHYIAYSLTRNFTDDGLEISREETITPEYETTAQVGDMTNNYRGEDVYECDFDRQRENSRTTKMRRDDIDVVYVYVTEGDKVISEGPAQLGNEHGLQTIDMVYPGGYEAIDEEQYERLITHGNSPEIQAALRERYEPYKARRINQEHRGR